MKLIKKYGRKTIYTDGDLWYNDACWWAGVDHVIYEQSLKNLMERINEYIKDKIEAFDDLFTSKKFMFRSVKN